MKSITINETKLNFIETNTHSLNTILFIHGNSHSLKTFSQQFRSPALKDYRLVSVDLPGHGESSKNGNYSLKSIALLLSAFIAELDLKNVVLAGHSLGGHIAINLLKFYKPRGLLVFGTPPLRPPFNPFVFLANANAKALTSIDATPAEVEAFMNEMNYKNESMELGISDYLRTDSVFRHEILADIIAGTNEDEVNLINSFNGEMLFLLASADSLINNNYILNEFQGTGKVLQEIEAGHSPHIETSDAFNRILADFAEKAFEFHLADKNKENSLQHESSYE